MEAVAGACRDESRICKVAEFDETYRLQEKGAILNWFDITAPEGYFSLNDKMGEIMNTQEGQALMKDFLHRAGQPKEADGEKTEASGGPVMNEKMLEMMNSFTVLRMVNLMGAISESATKEELLALNAKLNRIKKA